jgi:hypothetical protein
MPAHNAVAPAINVNMVLSFLVGGALITSPIEDSGLESKTKFGNGRQTLIAHHRTVIADKS